MTRNMNRRRLLLTGAAASGAAAASQLVTGQSAFADYAVAPARRRAASTLAAGDPIVVGYSRAVTAMKALPASNPCSWAAQAAIHFPGMGAAGPCNHTTHFWAWHRMYLYWFERIVRHRSGMYDWALPYWDYAWETSVSSATQRQIPAPLRVTTSSLYNATRNAALNGGGSLTAGVTATAGGLSPISYMTAQSSINGTPHGAVHVAVGGNMGSFPTAGLDPLFWLHHCQVDRLWNVWLAKGGGRSSPVGDATWRNTSFTFYDECCQPVQMTSCQILRAAQQLSYVYEVEPAQVNQSCPRTFITAVPLELIVRVAFQDAFVLENAVQRRPLVARQDRQTAARLMSHARSQTDTVVLQFKGVEADRHPGAMWEVYVGLPPQARASAMSPHFVGNLAMFGDGIRGEGHHPAEFTFPLNRALQGLTDASGLEVTLAPTSGVDVGGRPQPPQVRAPVRIGEVSLSLDRGRPAQ